MAWVDINYARSVVKQMYPNDKWRSRVRHMPDNQIFAIYHRHESDRYNKKAESKIISDTNTKNEKIQELFTPVYGEQLSFGGMI